MQTATLIFVAACQKKTFDKVYNFDLENDVENDAENIFTN